MASTDLKNKKIRMKIYEIIAQEKKSQFHIQLDRQTTVNTTFDLSWCYGTASDISN